MQLAMGSNSPTTNGRRNGDVAIYHKNVDNLLLHNPDPKSTYFEPQSERHYRDFAEQDRQKRQNDRESKQAMLDKRR